ncbi:hypothetical protein [Mammaliicoccus sciuri]|uniref:hypothetical protein n=1 Tax=Mammaliicoccus sciuri TaxID=1296 RepID=UPI002B256749|nr:hypothetical protein [Mammaliicoccus sciuri]WQK62761.1 hypothetical protein P3U20_11205 [Mammaliicoccus sciuri]
MPTIKTKKKMNLPQLIEWIWENEIEDKRFISDCVKGKVFVSKYGKITTACGIGKTDTFIVEIEEPITEDMKFQHTVERFISSYVNGYRYATHENKSIKDILNNRPPHVETTHIYAEVENELILIWKNGKLVE